MRIARRSRLALIFVLIGTAWLARADTHSVKPVEQGKFPKRVHVFEDYETEIEKRWWLRGKPETDAGTRVCRAAETLNFDRKMGDQQNKVKGVIFNPVPGPPMAGNTRLTFRYRIGGSDMIKVQIYSLSNNYHRYLTIAGLPQEKWQTATVDMTKARRPDGSGGALAEDERIDDIQFYVSPDTDLKIDDIVLYEAASAGEERPFPRRVIFTGWFDTGKQGEEWPGDFEIVLHEKPLTWDAARSVANRATGKPWLRVGLRGQRLLSPRTCVDFRYRISQKSALRAVLFDSKSGAEYVREVELSKVGDWSAATLDFLAPTGSGARHADEIRFFIDDGEAELLIDDLLIYEPG